MYWPNSVQQVKPNFLPASTMTPNYSENPTFGNPVMTSNNITNEHHMLGWYGFSLCYIKYLLLLFFLQWPSI
jgi:hypothetical protein